MSEPSEAGVSGGLASNIGQDISSAGRGLEPDCKLIRRAIREGWNIPPGAKKELVDRMVTVLRRPPPIDDFGNIPPGFDSAAVAAARVLVQADQVDQVDHWNEDKNARLDAGKATEIQAVQILTPQTRVRAMPPISPTSEPLPPAEAS